MSDKAHNLVQTLGWTHRGLDVQGAHVLPVLLQQGDQEIDRQANVLGELILLHVDVSNSDRQTQNLLHLELDGRLDLLDLSQHRLLVGEQTRELASLVQTGTQQTGNLLDQRLGSQESVVGLGQFLNQLLVLVQLLQSFGIHELDAVGLGLIAMLLVTQNAHLHLGTGDVLQPVSQMKTQNNK